MLSLILYALFAYRLDRTDFTSLFLLYSFSFIGFFVMLRTGKSNFKLLVIFAILFRLVFLFATPNLSQDFYRFIWDGRMLWEGFNPFLYTPESFISKEIYPVAQAQELFEGMGALNASHFTNYPPLMQVVFWLATLFSGKSILGSVIVFRTVIILADFVTLYYGQKLLKGLGLPQDRIFWYVLNPFIIIELTGNLHFEGIMLAFLIWSMYLLNNQKWIKAGIALGASISVKLLPLLLLPLFFQIFIKKSDGTKWQNYKKLAGFYSVIALTCLLLFAPFLSASFFTNYSNTVALWFKNFEFNASLYYIARAIGYWLSGYNQIGRIGPLIPIVTIITILIITFFRKNTDFKALLTAMLLSLSVYFFLSTTVHPWYLTTLLGLCVFTKYRFPIVWTFVIILSYYAYSNPQYHENLWIVSLEYTVVYLVFTWEITRPQKHSITTRKDRKLRHRG